MPALAGERARFLSPVDGDLVIGATQVRFEVDDRGVPVERIDVYVEGLLIGSALPPEWSFEWRAPSGLVNVPIVAGVFAGGEMVERVTIHTSEALVFGESLDVVSVELYPVVTNLRGAYVSDLGAEDFRVFDQGSEVALESFERNPANLNLVVLIDISESMKTKLSAVKEAASRFISRLRDEDQVAVYAFNHAVARGVELTRQHIRAQAQLRGYTASGGTALYDAVAQVLEDLETIRGRRALVLFSDGQDERSLTTLQRAVDLARRSEVIIYTVGAGESQEDLEARDDLRLLAEETGGKAQFIRKLKTLPRIFDIVLEDLGSQYYLSYTAPDGAAGLRQVVVQVAGSGYSVRCRKSYYYEGEDGGQG